MPSFTQGLSASRVGHYFAMGMQDFTPQSGRYDVIWIQWVIGHLTDGKALYFSYPDSQEHREMV